MSMNSSDAAWATAVTVLGGILLTGYVFLARSLGEGFAIPVGIITAVAAMVVLRGPVGKALGRRLEGGAAQPPSEEVLLELEDLRGRLLELEERMDFSERLLARGQHQPVRGPE